MNSGYRVKFGLPELPGTPSTNEMRAAIYSARFDSALIHSAMVAADIQGLSGEDRYTVLAYAALVALEKSQRRNIELLSRLPLGPPPANFEPPSP